MQVSVEDVSSLTKTLKIVIPENIVTKKIENAFNKLKSDVSIKGFRKGKVPRKVLEKAYGEKVKLEVGEKLVQDTYFDALDQTKCHPVVHPEIKSHTFADDGTFIYEAEIDVKPEFELGVYKGIEVGLPEILVDEETIDAEVEKLRKELAPLRNVDDREVKDNDLVVVTFQGYDEEGEPIKQIAGENYSVEVGSGRNGKEFEQACLGLIKDEETTKNVQFPSDFANPMLAGKKVQFKIKAIEIKERVLADLDDDFAKDVNEKFETLADLRNHLKEKVLKEKNDARSGDMTDQVMMQVLDNHKFEVPARLVAQEIGEQIKQLEEQLKRQNMTLESAGLSEAKLIEDYKESAERRIRGDFILKKIGEVEKIKISESDLTKAFERVAQQYSMPIEEVKKFFQNRNDLLPLMNELLNEKILEFLKENTVIKEVRTENDKTDTQKAGDSA